MIGLLHLLAPNFPSKEEHCIMIHHPQQWYQTLDPQRHNIYTNFQEKNLTTYKNWCELSGSVDVLDALLHSLCSMWIDGRHLDRFWTGDGHGWNRSFVVRSSLHGHEMQSLSDFIGYVLQKAQWRELQPFKRFWGSKSTVSKSPSASPSSVAWRVLFLNLLLQCCRHRIRRKVGHSCTTYITTDLVQVRSWEKERLKWIEIPNIGESKEGRKRKKRYWEKRRTHSWKMQPAHQEFLSKPKKALFFLCIKSLSSNEQKWGSFNIMPNTLLIKQSQPLNIWSNSERHNELYVDVKINREYRKFCTHEVGTEMVEINNLTSNNKQNHKYSNNHFVLSTAF